MKKILATTVALTALCTTQSFADSKITYCPIQAAFNHTFESDADGGGAFSKNEFSLKAGVPIILKDDLTFALTPSYKLTSYDFELGQVGSFTALAPWDDIHTIKVGSYIRWAIDDNWTLIATPSVSSTAESNAPLSDSFSADTIVGLQYKLSDSLTLGSGFGISSQLEDSISLYPILIIDWQINESLSLSTTPPTGVNFGPSLALNWDICDTQRASFGFSYERTRFRLDKDNTAAPKGVGEDSGIPVFAAYTWKPSDNSQVSLVVGVRLAAELELDDKSGNSIMKEETDSVPFLGLNIGYSF